MSSIVLSNRRIVLSLSLSHELCLVNSSSNSSSVFSISLTRIKFNLNNKLVNYKLRFQISNFCMLCPKHCSCCVWNNALDFFVDFWSSISPSISSSIAEFRQFPIPRRIVVLLSSNRWSFIRKNARKNTFNKKIHIHKYLKTVQRSEKAHAFYPLKKDN